jgi:hypothetical protein
VSKGEFNDFVAKVEKFIEQYELDARGDKTFNNGNRGFINEIREIKEKLNDYPSTLWLLAHRPLQTIVTILGLDLLLYFSYTYFDDWIKAIFAAIGIKFPQ